MRRKIYNNCQKLIAKVKELQEEADKLANIAEEHLENGNELEWKDAFKESVEKDGFADGIEFALKTLELM